MSDARPSGNRGEPRLRATEERFRFAQEAGGIGLFEWDLATDEWEWTPHLAVLFGFDPNTAPRSFVDWRRAIFIDDVPKLRAAAEDTGKTGDYYVEFRVRHADGTVHWIAAKGETVGGDAGHSRSIADVCYDISQRKQLEARLLAANETLEQRVVAVREEARTLEILNRTGEALASELSLERLVQQVTDAGVELTGAQFGAFFYNLLNEAGESYTLYTLSGAPREAFVAFPMPRNTAVFEPTFSGAGPMRSDDILIDPRYGKSAPYHGMPPGHLPVRSYLAVPVVSRSGEVLGGLFFGHPEPGVFTQRAEHIMVGVAAQAAIAIDNARLYEAAQGEVAARRKAEEELQQRGTMSEGQVLNHRVRPHLYYGKK